MSPADPWRDDVYGSGCLERCLKQSKRGMLVLQGLPVLCELAHRVLSFFSGNLCRLTDSTPMYCLRLRREISLQISNK